MSGTTEPSAERRAWRGAAALVAVAFATSVAQPSVLVAVPLLVLIGMGGVRGGATFVATVVAMLVVLFGPRDGYWYAERAWALVAGGLFVALSIGRPSWTLTSRTLASVGGTVVAFAALLAVRSDAWAALDWAVSDRLRSGFATWMDAMTVLRDGQAPSPALTSAIYRTVEAQVTVFPALLAVETMAALAATWWLYVRIVHRTDDGLGPLARFRFNDHLVWLMIGGLALVAGWANESVTRVGANLAVFMAALYAARGLAVGVAVSGGISLLGTAMIVLGILFAAPVVIGVAVLLGVADTWLDLRTRAESNGRMRITGRESLPGRTSGRSARMCSPNATAATSPVSASCWRGRRKARSG